MIYQHPYTDSIRTYIGREPQLRRPEGTTNGVSYMLVTLSVAAKAFGVMRTWPDLPEFSREKLRHGQAAHTGRAREMEADLRGFISSGPSKHWLYAQLSTKRPLTLAAVLAKFAVWSFVAPEVAYLPEAAADMSLVGKWGYSNMFGTHTVGTALTRLLYADTLLGGVPYQGTIDAIRSYGHSTDDEDPPLPGASDGINDMYGGADNQHRLRVHLPPVYLSATEELIQRLRAAK